MSRTDRLPGPASRPELRGVLARLPLLERAGASLRARLTLAFAAIILVTLFLAGSAFVFVLQDYQAGREMNRVADLTLPLSSQVRSLEQLGASPPEIIDFLERQADDLDVRIVLADSRGVVFADTDDSLVGRQLRIQNAVRSGLQRRVRQATTDGPDGELTFVVSPAIAFNPQQSGAGAAAPAPGTLSDRLQARQSADLVGVSVPRQSLATAWLELLPKLSIAALGALLLSIGLAWPLAASIARPLTGMTRAAEGIAQGRYDQQIPVRGRDEVARLAQAFNKMAREVSASHRTLRDFVANVSHDLRTPLTSIQGFSQALTDGTLIDRSEVAEAGRVINQEAARMDRLVDDLLYLSKMESGQAPLERCELDLAPLVAGRVEAMARRAKAAGVELRWSPEPAPKVLADPRHLERVVDNLLDNALRHTSPGGQVTVRLGSGMGQQRPSGAAGSTRWKSASSRDVDRAGARATALLVVRNTGSSIPTDELARVFERFYQIDRARAAGGSGLGLTISREIVQAHGGRCWAESAPETGTEFFVELPGLAAEQPAAARPGSPSAALRDVIPVGSANTLEG